jgi:WD40 repeat protein
LTDIKGRCLSTFNTTSRVFISYARSDGEEIARSLRTRLEEEHPEITLWLDRAKMIGGVGWWKQITEALDRVEILIMVLTPGALHSDVAAKEWRYARQQGVRICPVAQDISGLDFTVLPRWMRKAHCYNLTREWETFVAYLYSPGKNNRVPFMAPDLPDRYVQRSAEFQTILARLINESGENGIAGATVLQGAGGFGKTTLACMLCHNENIISTFDDGILWATLGDAPNIQGELTKLYAALTGERPLFVDIDDASIQLSACLEQKNCLLVVDDVWDPNHLKPFMRGGGQCARLLTTRQLSIASELGLVRTLIDRMTADEAVQLLVARAPSSMGNHGAFLALAERLGYWPLLLKLAGSQLRERMDRGDSLEGALAYMERAMEKRGVVAFDRAGRTERSDAVASTVAASLELFSGEEQMRCAQLAIFRGDNAFPLSAASALWDLDGFESESFMLRLDDAALLEFDLKTGNIRLHNVLRSYFEARIKSPRELHAKLADRWLQNPYALPDIYAWTWIGWHLAKGGQLDRLKQLLLDYEWLKTRICATSIQIALQDFDLIEDSDDIKVVRDALMLATDGLSFDAGQLRIQLHGRIDRGRSVPLDRLLDQSDKSEPRPRLNLSGTSLTHPGGALTGILKSHVGAVEALALSFVGRWLVSGSQDWSVRLWDLETNSVVRTFEGHQGTVHAVAMTPDGQAILSGSEDRTLRLWDAATGHMRQLFRGHTLAVRGVAMAADGKLAYSASEDGTVREWNIATGETSTLFSGRSHQLKPLAVTSDAHRLMFGAGDWTIRVVDLTNKQAITLEGHSGIVRSLACSPDNSTLISGGDDGVVRVWSLATGTSILELRGHSESVEAVTFGSSGKTAISGSRDRTLCLWNLETGLPLQVLKGHSGFVRAVAFSSSTGGVISGSTDRTIRHWNLKSHSEDKFVDGHSEAVSRLAISSDGSRAISGSGGSDLLVWNAADQGEGNLNASNQDAALSPHVSGHLQGHTGRIQAVEMTADGRRAVTGSRDRTLRIWDLGQTLTTHVLKGHTREILDLQISADGGRVVSLSRDRTLRIWDMQTGRAIRALLSVDNERARASLGVSNAMIAELETGLIVDLAAKPLPHDPSIALSPDGSRVVVGSQGNVCVWNLDTGTTDNQELADMDIVAIEFEPGSKRILMGSLFGPLLLWRLGYDPDLLEGHSGRILDLVVTPDGRSAASAATDDTIRIWDLDARRQRRQIQGCVGHADAVVIARSGNIAYSVYGNAVVAYDLSDGGRLGSLSLDHQITVISVTPAGTRLAIGDLSGRVHFLSLQGKL